MANAMMRSPKASSRAGERHRFERTGEGIFASMRLRAWYPVHRFQSARPKWRVARRAALQGETLSAIGPRTMSSAAGPSSFHGRPFLRIGSEENPRAFQWTDRPSSAVARRSTMAVGPRRVSSPVTVPISSSSGTWSSRSGNEEDKETVRWTVVPTNGLSPSRLGVNSTAGCRKWRHPWPDAPCVLGGGPARPVLEDRPFAFGRLTHSGPDRSHWIGPDGPSSPAPRSSLTRGP